MLRGLFTNRLARNHLAEGLPPAWTVLADGTFLPAYQAAERLATEGQPVILMAGERYGMGSSRDWAAKGAALLGARAVVACSFERIHRTNLIGMGVLPIRIADDFVPAGAGIVAADKFEVDVHPDALTPNMPLSLVHCRASGERSEISCRAAVETWQEVGLLRQGGVLSAILSRTLAESGEKL